MSSSYTNEEKKVLKKGSIINLDSHKNINVHSKKNENYFHREKIRKLEE